MIARVQQPNVISVGTKNLSHPLFTLFFAGATLDGCAISLQKDPNSAPISFPFGNIFVGSSDSADADKAQFEINLLEFQYVTESKCNSLFGYIWKMQKYNFANKDFCETKY
jgi:hypothetical protein